MSIESAETVFSSTRIDLGGMNRIKLVMQTSQFVRFLVGWGLGYVKKKRPKTSRAPGGKKRGQKKGSTAQQATGISKPAFSRARIKAIMLQDADIGRLSKFTPDAVGLSAFACRDFPAAPSALPPWHRAHPHPQTASSRRRSTTHPTNHARSAGCPCRTL